MIIQASDQGRLRPLRPSRIAFETTHRSSMARGVPEKLSATSRMLKPFKAELPRDRIKCPGFRAAPPRPGPCSVVLGGAPARPHGHPRPPASPRAAPWGPRPPPPPHCPGPPSSLGAWPGRSQRPGPWAAGGGRPRGRRRRARRRRCGWGRKGGSRGGCRRARRRVSH